MAAPLGNVNNLKTGKRTARHGMVLSTLGKKYRTVQGYVKRLRQDLEAHAKRVHGELTPRHFAEVNLAARYETSALIAQRLIAGNPDLPAAEVLSLLRTVCWATTERNRAIERLGLDAALAPPDPWSVLDAQRTLPPPAVQYPAVPAIGIEQREGQP